MTVASALRLKGLRVGSLLDLVAATGVARVDTSDRVDSSEGVDRDAAMLG